LQAHRIGPSAPTRGIALVARRSTARETEFEALAGLIRQVCNEDANPLKAQAPRRRRN
jgi:molybdopterin synthase catalytic subunit